MRYTQTCDCGLWDVKLWRWDIVVNKCLVNTWCDNNCVVSYELYNNPIGVYLEKSVYVRSVKKESVGSQNLIYKRI